MTWSLIQWDFHWIQPFLIPCIILENNQYYLVGWDACSDATLHYQDQYFQYNCDSAFQELIIRTWTAEDMNGNSSTCHDSIKVERVRIADLQLPLSYNNIDSAALECNGDWIALTQWKSFT
jgi:hypothetical protein